MTLNHKDAVEHLVDMSGDIGFDRRTVLNLHALLAGNLLADRTAEGRLRRIAVSIGGPVFHPPEAPQLVEGCFDQLLATAAAVEDPFEQSLFFMAQLPCLQPFDDVNKRVSRLGANIPLIKANLSPLSFVEVPRSVYADAMPGVYEMNRTDLLKDVYVWAHERSAARYAAVRQATGEPDPFRFRHRAALRGVVGGIVRRRMGRREAFAHIASWAGANVGADERERFREAAEDDVPSLHEGNYARYRVRSAEFSAWRDVWAAGT